MYRFIARVVPVCLGFAFVGGCSPAPNQAAIEKMVRDEMSVRLEADVTELKLTPQPDGGYTGTAAVANGDTYDVVVDRPRGGRVKWRIMPSQAMAERIVRAGLESQNQCRVKSLDLTKRNPGEYEGTAELENGTRTNVATRMRGNNFEWEAGMKGETPSQATVEREVREGIEAQRGVRVKTLKLTRQRRGTYTGRAELDDGTKMKVTTELRGENLWWDAVVDDGL